MIKAKEKEPIFYANKSSRNDCLTWTAWVKGQELFCFEAAKSTHSWGASVRIGGESKKVQFHVAGFGLSLFATFRNVPLIRRFTQYDAGGFMMPYSMKTGISLFAMDRFHPLSDWDLNIEFLHYSDIELDGPRWNGPRWSIDIPALLFGKRRVNTKVLQTKDSSISFIEGSYPVIVEIEEVETSRTRYPSIQSFYRAEISVSEELEAKGRGIPDGRYVMGESNEVFSACFPMDMKEIPQMKTMPKEGWWKIALNKFNQDIRESRCKNGWSFSESNQS